MDEISHHHIVQNFGAFDPTPLLAGFGCIGGPKAGALLPLLFGCATGIGCSGVFPGIAGPNLGGSFPPATSISGAFARSRSSRPGSCMMNAAGHSRPR